MAFAAIYLAEYSFIQGMSIIGTILFYGSMNPIIITTIIFIFIWVRATLPRIRYNTLLACGWTKILPLAISYIILTITMVLLLN